MQIGSWEHAGLTFQGLSLAGVRTALTLPQHSIAFDVANGLPHSIGMNTFLITHGHMDHAAGIPYVISQKAMNSHKGSRFIMPESMIEPLTTIMNEWSKIEGHQYNFEFLPAKAGDTFPLKSNLYIQCFPTIHRLPSLGYSLCRKFHKLRRDLEGLSQEEISKIRLQGEVLTEERNEILVSFTGDTQIEFLDHAPHVRESKILFIEATYLDERKSIDSAKEWGHTHLDELLLRLDTIKSERIVLIHTSARYSFEEAKKILMARIPSHESERVILFPGR